MMVFNFEDNVHCIQIMVDEMTYAKFYKIASYNDDKMSPFGRKVIKRFIKEFERKGNFSSNNESSSWFARRGIHTKGDMLKNDIDVEKMLDKREKRGEGE